MADAPKKPDQTPPPVRPTRDSPEPRRERVIKNDDPQPFRESTVTDTHKPPPPPEKD